MHGICPQSITIFIRSCLSPHHAHACSCLFETHPVPEKNHEKHPPRKQKQPLLACRNLAIVHGHLSLIIISSSTVRIVKGLIGGFESNYCTQIVVALYADMAFVQGAVLLLLLLLTLAAPCADAHGWQLPINPALGVPGYPDCRRPARLGTATSVELAAMELECFQRGAGSSAIKIGCVGDSITAGVHSSNRGTMAYPAQLQRMIDAAHGKGGYAVTNLGACGSTVLKRTSNPDQPYWERPQYKTLIENKWDIIVIMLGTNDANPDAWPVARGCGTVAAPTTENCQYGDDFVAMIAEARKLGTNSTAGPAIYVMSPPPLMNDNRNPLNHTQEAVYPNQTIINSMLPILVPQIGRLAKLTHQTINVFAGMGGTPQWNTPGSSSRIPHAGCTLATAKTFKPCAWWCDAQACGNCHPNDNGYTNLAKTVLAGLEPLPPAPPPAPPPPSCHQTKMVGCYNASTGGGSSGMSPWLPAYQPQLHDKVTLENCAGACDALKLPLAGIEGGNHCWCGRSVASVPTERERPQAECEVDHCHGNTSELCGGDLRMLVYGYACVPRASSA